VQKETTSVIPFGIESGVPSHAIRIANVGFVVAFPIVYVWILEDGPRVLVPPVQGGLVRITTHRLWLIDDETFSFVRRLDLCRHEST